MTGILARSDGLKVKSLNDGTNMHIFTSHDGNWCTGVDVLGYLWIIVMFYQLFGLSF